MLSLWVLPPNLGSADAEDPGVPNVLGDDHFLGVQCGIGGSCPVAS